MDLDYVGHYIRSFVHHWNEVTNLWEIGVIVSSPNGPSVFSTLFCILPYMWSERNGFSAGRIDYEEGMINSS